METENKNSSENFCGKQIFVAKEWSICRGKWVKRRIFEDRKLSSPLHIGLNVPVNRRLHDVRKREENRKCSAHEPGSWDPKSTWGDKLEKGTQIRKNV